MNKQINIKKIIYICIAILPIIIIIFLLPKSNISKREVTTIPLIPSRPTDIQIPKTSIEKTFTPDQIISFNLNEAIVSEDKNLKSYSIKTSIIESLDIEDIISKLNFFPIEKIPDTSDGSFNWYNSKASLIISPRDNYMYYQSHSKLPISNLHLSEDEIVNTSKEIINNLIGNNISNTISINKITYYKLNQDSVEEEPKIVKNEDSNLINISFNQSIDKSIVVTQSQESEIISITLDKDKKLYSLVVRNGFTSIEENGQMIESKIKEINYNSQKGIIRINNLSNMSFDKWYRKSKKIHITVNSVDIGYLSLEDRSLTPSYIINGTIKNSPQTSLPVIYTIPIPESL